VRALNDLRFAVVGAYVVDCFVRTPVLPVWDSEYEVHSVRTSPGGKALNQAVALARLGAQVSAVGVVGGDGYGRDILGLLDRERIDICWMDQRSDSPTAVCVCLVGDAAESSILWHIDDDMAVTAATVRNAADAISDADAVLMTFEMPPESISETIRLASDHGTGVIVQPAPVLQDEAAARSLPWDLVDLVVPNRDEARRLLVDGQLPEVLLARAINEQFGVQRVVVTLGADGCVMYGTDGQRHYPAHSVVPVDTTGASDAFTATLAAFLTAGAAAPDAVDAAQRAAAAAISRTGGYESMPVY
jgi:ribokinase